MNCNASVNVSSEEIKKQVAELSKASTEIDRTRKSIVSQYQQLGTTWNDAKYKALGDIVQESNSSLRNIEKIFLQSQKALLSILSVVQEYEASNLYPTGAVSGGISDGGSDGGFTRHLSPDEVNARWQSGVESINEQIANYREALLSRGVPECKWLNETLAKHRAQMLEQQGYDLDVASGHGADSVHNGDAYHYPGDYNEFYNQLADEFRQHSLTETNPHYSEAPHWRDNCQRCVPALEMRRRGEEVTARPSTYGSHIWLTGLLTYGKTRLCCIRKEPEWSRSTILWPLGATELVLKSWYIGMDHTEEDTLLSLNAETEKQFFLILKRDVWMSLIISGVLFLTQHSIAELIIWNSPAILMNVIRR